MYSLGQLRRAVKDPRRFAREINRLYHRRGRTLPYNTDGVDVFAEDWDTLVLLDACRYDMFEERAELPGNLESRISRGGSTFEFLKANVEGRNLTDTVYLTANPMYYKNREGLNASFHAVVNVWLDDGWDDEYRTVRPEVVTESALNAADQYPNKRLLIHYVQPHYPFIGPTGREHFPGRSLNLWEEMSENNIDLSEAKIWQAFRENLDMVLPSVRNLMTSLEGRTIVSSDHGQLVGERLFPVPIRDYGHPPGVYVDPLVRVPWHVYDSGDRRTIRRDPPVDAEMQSIEDADVEERLADLGYV